MKAKAKGNLAFDEDTPHKAQTQSSSSSVLPGFIYLAPSIPVNTGNVAEF
jgi:hypothetical protein